MARVEPHAAGGQMPLFAPPAEPRRREPREDVVRAVDYCRFPRTGGDAGLRRGFTRDVSESGLCLRVDAAEPRGSLLRVVVRSADGQPAREALARVAWLEPTVDGGFWLGLALLEARGQASVRPGGPGRADGIARVA